MFLRYSTGALVVLSLIYGDDTRSFIESRRNGKTASGGGAGLVERTDSIQRGAKVWCEPHHSFAMEPGVAAKRSGGAEETPGHRAAEQAEPRPIATDPQYLRPGGDRARPPRQSLDYCAPGGSD